MQFLERRNLFTTSCLCEEIEMQTRNIIKNWRQTSTQKVSSNLTLVLTNLTRDTRGTCSNVGIGCRLLPAKCHHTLPFYPEASSLPFRFPLQEISTRLHPLASTDSSAKNTFFFPVASQVLHGSSCLTSVPRHCLAQLAKAYHSNTSWPWPVLSVQSTFCKTQFRKHCVCILFRCPYAGNWASAHANLIYLLRLESCGWHRCGLWNCRCVSLSTSPTWLPSQLNEPAGSPFLRSGMCTELDARVGGSKVRKRQPKTIGGPKNTQN